MIKIILVEDSEAIQRALVTAMSEILGMEVVSLTATAKDTINYFENFADSWQVAVVDLFLKQGTGIDVLIACRERSPLKKVIVLTNFATADIKKHCLSLGADAVFDKATQMESFFDYCACLVTTLCRNELRN